MFAEEREEEGEKGTSNLANLTQMKLLMRVQKLCLLIKT